MLFFHLQKNNKQPLYEQLYSKIKKAILAKELLVGTKLPSKRKLASFLSISQTTVEVAYAQLVAEGYVKSTNRKGFFVENVAELAYVESKNYSASINVQEKVKYEVNFSSSTIDTTLFPFSVWKKLARDCWDDANEHLLLTGDTTGDVELRKEIANYLYSSRGVKCSPEQIIIGSGTEQLLPQLVALFDRSSVIALENPGYPMTQTIFDNAGFPIIPIQVDKDGLNIHELEKSHANVCYVTPSHQFPTGSVLPISRRTQLLNWAHSNENRYIIEDDYDSEFRYNGKPIPSLQGMDKGEKVIYISTFSKSLSPSLRIAFSVLPWHLVFKYKKIFASYSCTVPRMEQQMMAKFMSNGHFARHLNKMRAHYRKKSQIVLSTCAKYESTIKVSGADAGMHVVLSINTSKTEQQLIEIATLNGIKIFGLSYFNKTTHFKNEPQFILGFGGIPLDNIPSHIHQLMQIWDIRKTSI